MSLLIGMAVAVVICIVVCRFIDNKPLIPARLRNLKTPNLASQLKSSANRVRKIEEDGLTALNAIKNLHETKKRLNSEFRENWDNQFRLLLPPPVTPNRLAVRWKGHYSNTPMRVYLSPSSGISEEKIEFDRSTRAVPVGAIRRGGEWWYGFNNLPGYPHRMMFQRVSMFHYVEENRFWAFLPTIRETNDGYVWEENKTKILASNIKESIQNIEIRIG